MFRFCQKLFSVVKIHDIPEVFTVLQVLRSSKNAKATDNNRFFHGAICFFKTRVTSLSLKAVVSGAENAGEY